MATMRPILSVLLLVLLATLAAPADAVKARQRGKLDQVQAAWASAVRWSEFESAWELVDPALRAQRPMSELEFERYRQLQVTSYREGGNGQLEDGTVVRAVEIGVINRHTQAERSERYQERWRWAQEARRGWQSGGRPPLLPSAAAAPPVLPSSLLLLLLCGFG